MILLLLLPVFIIVLVRQSSQANYLFSSSYKIIFLFPLFSRFIIDKKIFKESLFEGFSFEVFKKNVAVVLCMGIGLAAVYLMGYFFLKQSLKIGVMVAQLNQSASINAKNIIFIGLYIIVFNSLLEEFFWRGFMFKELKELIGPWMAHAFTGIAFSFHHIMFYFNWFGYTLLILVTAGLIIFTILMNFIFQRYQDLFSCWLIHGMVDTVQVFIALRIFGII